MEDLTAEIGDAAPWAVAERLISYVGFITFLSSFLSVLFLREGECIAHPLGLIHFFEGSW